MWRPSPDMLALIASPSDNQTEPPSQPHHHQRLLAEGGDPFTRNFTRLFYSSPVVEMEYVHFNARSFRNMDRGAILCMGVISILQQLFIRSSLSRLLWAVGALFTLCILAADWVISRWFTRIGRDPALLHELIVWLGLLGASLQLGLTYPKNEMECQQPHVSLLVTSPQQLRDICVHSIDSFPFLVLGAAFVSGRPRVAMMLVCGALFIVSKNAALYFYGKVDTHEEIYLKAISDTCCFQAYFWGVTSHWSSCIARPSKRTSRPSRGWSRRRSRRRRRTRTCRS